MYATPEDLLATFEEGDLIAATNLRDPRASQVVQERLAQHCKIATGIVNGYLMQRFVIPLISPDNELLETLNAHTINLARESLDASSEEVRTKAENSRRWLEAFTSNTGNSTTSDPTPGVDPIASIAFSIKPPVFDCDSLSALGW